MKDMNEAVIARIHEILTEQKISICDLALKGGLTPSTVYELMQGRTRVPKIITIKKLCDGANITLSEFFNRDYFNDFYEK